MRHGRGFSLAELQITMFLILMVLLMLAAIGREYANVNRQSTGKELTLQAATVGLDSVARDLRSSVEVLPPLSGGGIAMRVVNPNKTDRLFANPTPPPQPDLNLNAPANLLQIRYELEGQRLMRRVLAANGALLSAVPVAEGLAGLSAEMRADRTVEIVLSVQEQKRVRRLSTVALLRPQGPGPGP